MDQQAHRRPTPKLAHTLQNPWRGKSHAQSDREFRPLSDRNIQLWVGADELKRCTINELQAWG